MTQAIQFSDGVVGEEQLVNFGALGSNWFSFSERVVSSVQRFDKNSSQSFAEDIYEGD